VPALVDLDAAQVHDFDLTRVEQHNVARLEVAVDEAVFVHALDDPHYARDQILDLVGRLLLDLLDFDFQVFPLELLHLEIHLVFRLDFVLQFGEAVRAVERELLESLDFVFDEVHGTLALHEVQVDLLERDPHVGHVVIYSVHRTESPLSNLSLLRIPVLNRFFY